MNSIGKNTHDYWLTLPLHRQEGCLLDWWGARPSWSVDMVEDNRRRRIVVVVVKLVNFVEQAELAHPPPVVYTAAWSRKLDLNALVSAALWQWHVSVYHHLDDGARAERPTSE